MGVRSIIRIYPGVLGITDACYKHATTLSHYVTRIEPYSVRRISQMLSINIKTRANIVV
jgi:hypothetical protein